MKTKRPNGPDLFQATKQEYLGRARATARRLLERREYITSEDVTALCPLPRFLHRNLIGAIFQHKDFQMVGIANARRPVAKGRLIRKWALKNPKLPQKWVPLIERDEGR